MADDGNALYYGDNLDVLRRYFHDETVDLVYLDPPFNSNASYNALFGEQDGTQSAAQIHAFEDTWRWDIAAAATYESVIEEGGNVAQALMAFRTFLGPSNMLAYLSMMAPRLVELRKVLKPTGSLYLHCDPTASHYLKMLLDAVFGAECFRSEVVWQRAFAAKGHAARNFSANHDLLLVYSRSENYYFAPVHLERTEEYEGRFKYDDDDGRGPYRLAPMDNPGIRPNLMYEYKGYPSPTKGWRVSREVMEQS